MNKLELSSSPSRRTSLKEDTDTPRSRAHSLSGRFHATKPKGSSPPPINFSTAFPLSESSEKIRGSSEKRPKYTKKPRSLEIKKETDQEKVHQGENNLYLNKRLTLETNSLTPISKLELSEKKTRNFAVMDIPPFTPPTNPSPSTIFHQKEKELYACLNNLNQQHLSFIDVMQFGRELETILLFFETNPNLITFSSEIKRINEKTHVNKGYKKYLKFAKKIQELAIQHQFSDLDIGKQVNHLCRNLLAVSEPHQIRKIQDKKGLYIEVLLLRAKTEWEAIRNDAIEKNFLDPEYEKYRKRLVDLRKVSKKISMPFKFNEYLLEMIKTSTIVIKNNIGQFREIKKNNPIFSTSAIQILQGVLENEIFMFQIKQNDIDSKGIKKLTSLLISLKKINPEINENSPILNRSNGSIKICNPYLQTNTKSYDLLLKILSTCQSIRITQKSASCIHQIFSVMKQLKWVNEILIRPSSSNLLLLKNKIEQDLTNLTPIKKMKNLELLWEALLQSPVDNEYQKRFLIVYTLVIDRLVNGDDYPAAKLFTIIKEKFTHAEPFEKFQLLNIIIYFLSDKCHHLSNLEVLSEQKVVYSLTQDILAHVCNSSVLYLQPLIEEIKKLHLEISQRVPFPSYPSLDQHLNFDRAKAPGVADRKSAHLSNVDRLLIGQSKDLWYASRSNVDPDLSILQPDTNEHLNFNTHYTSELIELIKMKKEPAQAVIQFTDTLKDKILNLFSMTNVKDWLKFDSSKKITELIEYSENLGYWVKQSLFSANNAQEFNLLFDFFIKVIENLKNPSSSQIYLFPDFSSSNSIFLALDSALDLIPAICKKNTKMFASLNEIRKTFSISRNFLALRRKMTKTPLYIPPLLLLTHDLSMLLDPEINKLFEDNLINLEGLDSIAGVIIPIVHLKTHVNYQPSKNPLNFDKEFLNLRANEVYFEEVCKEFDYDKFQEVMRTRAKIIFPVKEASEAEKK